jgi:predicted ArsR family transcriptional regulator
VGALAGFGRRGRAAARKAGRGFRPQTRPAAGAGVREALEPLSDFGARYEVRGERIVAHNCVFVEACHDGIACEVQAGILEGALERAGVKGELKPEGREGGGCSYRLILKTED